MISAGISILKMAVSVIIGVGASIIGYKVVDKVSTVFKESSDHYKEEELFDRVCKLKDEFHEVEVKEYLINKQLEKLGTILTDVYDENSNSGSKVFDEVRDDHRICEELKHEIRKEKYRVSVEIAMCQHMIADLGNYNLEYDSIENTYKLVEIHKRC